ncbi:hypothetical protein BDR22DRAFT_885246 [Usnea florida]
MLFSKLLLAAALLGTTTVMGTPMGATGQRVEAGSIDPDYKRELTADYTEADYKRGADVKADYKRGNDADYEEADYKRGVKADY